LRSYTYTFQVGEITINATTWFDPVIAIGFDYYIDKGPKINAVELPKGIGDNVYDLWLFDAKANKFVDSGVDVLGGEKYPFKEPVEKFSIRGIEVSAALDPEDEQAFPIGLSFDDNAKKLKMHMILVTVDTDKM
jgi:hypothetical protein